MFDPLKFVECGRWPFLYSLGVTWNPGGKGGRAGAQSCSRMEQFDQLLTCCICLDR